MVGGAGSGAPGLTMLGASGLLLLALGLVADYERAQRVLTLLLLAPLLEEAIFRAGLQEALLRRWQSHPRLANVATAAAFGLAHVVIRADFAAFSVALPALLIGEVYQRTGRLRLCVALHAAMNATWLAWNTAGPLLSSH